MKPFKLIQALFGPVPRHRAIDCFERVRSGTAILIDVREPDEWTAGVAERAVLLSLSDLSGPRAQWTPFLATHRERELLFYCGAGVRSAMAARILAREGFRTANAGSFKEWAAAGWPVVAPRAR
ncbi:MAG: rhodanese-like domain-containing protein [Opitutaceae bacterium]|nr:rhodanese-like domain-containing protein [Opitutaceae bacterium]